MNDTIKILFGLFGGLAIFIFGMNMMSECLQKVAGDKMKNILSMLTRNPLLGALAGAVTTAVLQSSSATTVMAIGFVSAGLMTLPQAISIILGANIGTTMTAQIIAFKISDYIYLFIAAGFIVFFVSKSEKIKNIGQTVFAFGLLFEGIEIMGSVMKPLAGSPVFTDLMSKVSGIPVLGVCLGTIMTLVVQSSSATIAVLQNFASQAGPDGVTSIIGLAGAIPILLGDNIGTTITAILASVGQSKDAKRTAVAHSVFNISGALLFIWFIKPFAAFIQNISPKGVEVEVIARQIANAHTTFNIVMTLIWLPLIGVLVKIVMAIIPDRKANAELLPDEPKYLDGNLIGQPSAALHLVTREVLRVSQEVSEVLNKFDNLSEKNDSQEYSEIVEEANLAHSLTQKINDYLATMFSEGVMTEEQANASANLLYVLCDIDRIGYLCRDITQAMKSENGKKTELSKDAVKELKKSIRLIVEMYTYAVEVIEHGTDAKMKNVQRIKEEIMQLDNKMRRNHIARVKKKKCDAKLTPAYNEILHNIDRMGNSCVNLMELAQNGISFEHNLVLEADK